jgi:hypothetical protein
MKLRDIVNDVIFNDGIHSLLEDALAGRRLKEHPYKRFVECQMKAYGKHFAREGFQIGELWGGDLKRARVLFLSPNPSIDIAEYYPRYHVRTRQISMPDGTAMSVDDVERFFTDRFRDVPVNGLALHGWQWGPGGKVTSPNAVKFWGCVRNSMAKIMNVALNRKVPAAARELMKYAVTIDMVPFKSGAQYSVDEALYHCVRKFAVNLLPYVSAPIVVLVGKKVQGAFLDLVLSDDEEWGKAKEAFDTRRIYHCDEPVLRNKLVIAADFNTGTFSLNGLSDNVLNELRQAF